MIETRPIGNTKLLEHGIQNEESDFRIHVCIRAHRAYVFKTDEGKKAVLQAQSRKYARMPIYTGKILTADGYLVPCDDLCANSYVIPEDLIEKYAISQYESTSIRGAKATSISAEMIKRGIILLPINVIEVDNKRDQIKGIDINVSTGVKIQVKCDTRGGHRQFGGTGNLYLQTAECNPYKSH